MTVAEIMLALEAMGDPKIKAIHANHAGVVPSFGVKVADLKTLLKNIKSDRHALALELFETSNQDAQYLAGLMADAKKIQEADLKHWAQTCLSAMIAEYIVAALAAESPYGWELAHYWIDGPDDRTTSIGWATLSGWVALKPDEALDIPELTKLLDRVVKTLHLAGNRTRYCMNGFAISLGCYVAELKDAALEAGNQLGRVEVNMGNTACKVPPIVAYIEKVVSSGRLGKKRKHIRC